MGVHYSDTKEVNPVSVHVSLCKGPWFTRAWIRGHGGGGIPNCHKPVQEKRIENSINLSLLHSQSAEYCTTQKGSTARKFRKQRASQSWQMTQAECCHATGKNNFCQKVWPEETKFLQLCVVKKTPDMQAILLTLPNPFVSIVIKFDIFKNISAHSAQYLSFIIEVSSELRVARVCIRYLFPKFLPDLFFAPPPLPPFLGSESIVGLKVSSRLPFL
jgi:hypothetical protein